MNTVEKPLEYARQVVGRDPMAVHLGIEVEEVKKGYARCSVVIRPEYLNAVERAHGAIIYALADQAFAVASNSTGVMALGLNFNIAFMASAVDGERIFSEAHALHVGRKVSTWRVEVRGGGDALLASGQGTAYHR